MKKKTKSFFIDKLSNLYLWLILAGVVIIGSLVAGFITKNEILGFISNILQVVTVAFAIAAWFYARSRDNKFKEDLEKRQIAVGAVALVIDISKTETIADDQGGILGQIIPVISALNPEIWKDNLDESDYSDIPGKSKLFAIKVSNNHIVNIKGCKMPDDSELALEYKQEFVELLTKLTARFQSDGVMNIHLFIKGPVSLSFYVGWAFKNNFNVVNYHLNYDLKQYIAL